MRVNGTLLSRMASTNRCPQVVRWRGGLARVKPLMTTRATAPTASRPNATSTAEKDRRPSLIHQNEQPQIAASSKNDAGQGKALGRTEVRVFEIGRASCRERV